MILELITVRENASLVQKSITRWIKLLWKLLEKCDLILPQSARGLTRSMRMLRGMKK